MKYEDIRKRPAYITTNIQLELYDKVNQYLKENNMSRTEFARHLGVSKGYVTQLLNGEFDHRLSKFVELSTKIGYVPNVIFEPTDDTLNHSGINQLIHQLSNNIGCVAFLKSVRRSVETGREDSVPAPEKFDNSQITSAA